jgi:predicted Zn-dependent protease
MRHHGPWSGAVLVLALSIAACSRQGGETSVNPSGVQPPLEAVPLRPLPRAQAGVYRTIVEKQAAGRFGECLQLYPQVLGGLETLWGKTSRDLAPYHYNWCLALLLAGKPNECLHASEEGLERWPRCLQSLLINLKARFAVSRSEGRLLDGTRERFQRLLEPRHLTALESLHVDAVGLRVEYADLLFVLQRPSEALDEVSRAVEGSPLHVEARRLKAEILVAMRRSADAIPLLGSLAAESDPPDPDLECLHAIAQLEAGSAEDAWSRFQKLLAGASGGSPSIDTVRLRRHGAQALNRLGRYAEARDLLLDVLLVNPDDAECLHHLAAALQGLGREAASAALRRRAQELSTFREESERAADWRRRKAELTAWYHEALAWTDADRLGEALESMRGGLRAARGSRELELMALEIGIQVGRLPRLVREMEDVVQLQGRPLERLAHARWLARLGRLDESRQVAGGVGKALPALAIETQRSRVLIELGDTEEAQALLAAVQEESPAQGAGRDAADRKHAAEVSRLCEAERLIALGRPREACGLLSQDFRALPGGRVWADLLRRLCEDGDAPERSQDLPVEPDDDPSGLIDHPRFLRVASLRHQLRSSRGFERFLRSADSFLARRQRILERMGDFSDGDVLGLWAELLALYEECGARRKAREAAWYLWARSSADSRPYKWLAAAQSRPEEVIGRRFAVEKGLRAAPDDVELLEMRRGIASFLGLGR